MFFFFPLSVRAEDPEQAEGLLLLSLIERMGLQSCMEKFTEGFAVIQYLAWPRQCWVQFAA